MKIEKFSQSIIEKLGYYVYILKDPLSKEIFYIGKGKGNRIFAHLNRVLENPSDSDKYNKIKEILDRKMNVEHYILRHGLDEKTAIEIESSCIDLLGLEQLTNAQSGHDTFERGLKSINEVIQQFDARIINITESCLIIIVNKLYKRHMSDEDLYKITSGIWTLDKKRKNKVKYAIASYRSLVREVYEVHSWSEEIDRNGKRRWRFTGKIADEMIRSKYLNQSLSNYKSRGNPIYYVNC